mmetsp:Transcript_16603/g.33612  ORF Transcript_16603/g.33612 Transcript_16603/m.33612 type:complete len:304 (+) Transcript_16603:1363-2274(+)
MTFIPQHYPPQTPHSDDFHLHRLCRRHGLLCLHFLLGNGLLALSPDGHLLIDALHLCRLRLCHATCFRAAIALPKFLRDHCQVDPIVRHVAEFVAMGFNLAGEIQAEDVRAALVVSDDDDVALVVALGHVDLAELQLAMDAAPGSLDAVRRGTGFARELVPRHILVAPARIVRVVCHRVTVEPQLPCGLRLNDFALVLVVDLDVARHDEVVDVGDVLVLLLDLRDPHLQPAPLVFAIRGQHDPFIADVERPARIKAEVVDRNLLQQDQRAVEQRHYPNAVFHEHQGGLVVALSKGQQLADSTA